MKSSFQGAVLAISASALVFVQLPAAYAQSAADGGSFSATQIDGQTQVDKAIGKCVVSVIGGALVGALLGGRRNAGGGAAIGAAVGVGVCAVMISVASSQDKERLRQLELQAVNSGQSQTQDWQTSDGHSISATVTASNVVQVTAPKSNEVLNCRRANTQLSVNGQDTTSSDVVCLHGDSWVTLDKLKDLGIRPSDINV